MRTVAIYSELAVGQKSATNTCVWLKAGRGMGKLEAG